VETQSTNRACEIAPAALRIFDATRRASLRVSLIIMPSAGVIPAMPVEGIIDPACARTIRRSPKRSSPDCADNAADRSADRPSDHKASPGAESCANSIGLRIGRRSKQ